MKNLFKMTTAALALVAFASCSNEELFGNKTDIVTGDPLNIVSIEEPLAEGVVAGTRSSMDKDNNSNVVWDAKDVINVYDDQLYMSDAYTYDATTNRFLGTAKNVSEPKFGIYPKGSIYGTSNLDEKLILRMDLPSTIKYTTETETTIDGKTVYASNLPLWSPASKDADGVQMEKLRYLTAVLKIWLPNVPGNVNYLKIESNKHNLSGAFTAELDTENADAVQLKDGVKGDAHQKYIFVDLTKVPSNLSVVYLPIIAGTYEANDLTIYASTSTNITEANMGTALWTAIRTFDTGVTLKRAGFYNVKVSESAYGQKAENPVQMTHLLDLYKTNEVLQIATKNFTVNSGIPTVGNVIEIPEVTTTEPVVLDIQAGGTVTETTPDLTIQNAKDVDFDGTIIFKSNNAINHLNLTVDLPNADVIIGGNYTGKNVTIIAAKSVTLGDGDLANATTIATFAPTAITNSLTINDNATVTGAIDLKTPDIAGSTDFELNIKGTATDAFTGIEANLATVNMTGWTDANSVAHAAQVVKLTTKGGDVTIDLPTEGEAITTALNMYAANTNLILKQGYVKTLNVTASTAIANNKNLEVNINNAGQGLVAFQSVTSDGNAEINMTESPYVGEFNSITKAGTDPYTAYEYPTCKTIWTAQQLSKLNGVYNAGTHTMTPVNITAAAEIKLANTIDMKGEQWWGITTSGFGLVQFNGYNVLAGTKAAQTIKNIDFFKQVIIDADNAALQTSVVRGFFSNAASTGGLTVEKVNFTGVRGAFNYVWNTTAGKRRTLKELGAIVGTSAGAVTLTDVSVEITGDFGLSSVTNGNKANLQSATTQPNIGGLIGSANDVVTISNGQVTGAAIKGYGPIGGLVGFLAADKALTVKNNGNVKSSSKFSSYGIAFNSGDNSDFNYVKNGAVLGSLGVATATTSIFIDDNTAANWTYSFTNPGRAYVAQIVSPEIINEYDFTRDDVNLIGYFAGLEPTPDYNAFTIGGKTAKVVYADLLKPYGATDDLAAWKKANPNTLVLYYFPKK
jgi:hypothetical protein